MNRRELLKRAGVTALAGSFLSGARSGGDTLPSTASTCSTSSTFENLLLVRFLGPFTFELNANAANDICVTPPPVGIDFCAAPHQPWVGTTSYEMQLGGPSLSCLRLSMNFTCARTTAAQPPTGTTPLASYPRPTPTPQGCVSPLYSLWVPAPDRIVGIQPVDIYYGVCGTNSTGGSETVASGAIFTYHNVDITSIVLKVLACPVPSAVAPSASAPSAVACPVSSAIAPQSPSQPIQPQAQDFPIDFSIDAAEFPCANLDFHLTPNYQAPDQQHQHACAVVQQMKAMLPWIPDINLNPTQSTSAGGADCKAPVLCY